MFNSKILKSAVILAMSVIFAAGIVWASENEGDMTEELKMEFVRIPAGSFYMGSPSSEKDRNINEGPVHKVQLTKPFYIGRYEVTQAQWEAVMGTTISQQRAKSKIPLRLKGAGPEYPMYYVSWEEAVEFCIRLGSGFRLPTEAEWEYACRAGSQTRFYYGDDPNYSQLDQYAWYYGNSDNKTHPVGQKKPNSWGLYDMYGNVSEWCFDRFRFGGYDVDENIDKIVSVVGNPHIIRGGDWLEKSEKCRSASRYPGSNCNDITGFRVLFESNMDSNEDILKIVLPKRTSEVVVNQEQNKVNLINHDSSIPGVILDDDGMPIEGVEIEHMFAGNWFLRMYSNGEFETCKLSLNSEPKENRFLACHTERNLATVIEINEDANMIEVKLEPGVILTGKVVDSNGITIEGARVSTILQGPNWKAIIPPISMKSDLEGNFTFRALPLGHKYSLNAVKTGYRSNKIEFDSNDVPDKHIDLGSVVLARGKYSVSGIVVDANDKPVANASVHCTGEGQPGAGAVTDSDGRFKLDGIFKGQVHITAGLRHGKYGSWIISGFIDTEAGATDVKIVMIKNGAALPKGRACFPADTDVWINGKVLQISKVAHDQTVGKSGCIIRTAPIGQIEKIEEHEGVFECRDIVLENGNRIGVVDAHCFMLDSGQWVAAQDLKKGLRLKTLTGTIGIKSVTTRATPYVGKVYNLKIKDSDLYMVGKDGMIVRDY